MKEIEISEDQLGDLDALREMLFTSHIPGTPGYRRTLVRPRINWLAAAAYCLLPVACGVGAWFGLSALGAGYRWIALALPLLFWLLTLKQGIIGTVRLYQRLAPAAIRNSCRFEPSCSQYMILSIEKYGLWKGLKKGRNRLKRCSIRYTGEDNHGFDEP